METTVIDWLSLSAEDVLEAMSDAPRVASVWQYSDITRGYKRNLLWHPKKGSQVTWIDVGVVWSNGDNWWGYTSMNETEERRFGPFPDRFKAAEAVDSWLVLDGWKLCK